jgi:hypothetical protein
MPSSYYFLANEMQPDYPGFLPVIEVTEYRLAHIAVQIF